MCDKYINLPNPLKNDNEEMSESTNRNLIGTTAKSESQINHSSNKSESNNKKEAANKPSKQPFETAMESLFSDLTSNKPSTTTSTGYKLFKETMRNFCGTNSSSESRCDKNELDFVHDFLVSESVSGKFKDAYSESILKQLIRIFGADKNGYTIDDIIGLFDPSPMNCLTDNYSGILFTKEAFYFKQNAKSRPLPVRYRNVDFVEQKFSSLIIYLRSGSPITLKGISFSTDNIYKLFSSIARYYDEQ